jgi:flavin-dependent dehydrogenase
VRNNSKLFDVLIIGGGPAGCAAALTLLNQTSLEVGVIESTDYSNMRVGESVSPSIRPLMRYLGIENEFLAGNHITSQGLDAAWGSSKILSRDYFFTVEGNGWNLDRQMFDSMLAESVKKRNGSLFTSTKISRQNKNNEVWDLVATRSNDTKIRLQANFVIDASGKKASFARNLGAKWRVLDYLVGIATMYDIPVCNEISSTLIESTSEGWWYSTPIPNNKRIVAFMTDSDIARKIKIQKLAIWNLFLKKTLHIRKTIDGARLFFTPKIFPAYSQIIKKSNPSGWVPAGDAIASFDPLSSIGIGHAIVSGIEAARVAYNTIKSDGRLLSQYLDNAIANFDQYVNNRKHFYGYEKRWKENPFWKRRQ